MRGAAPAAALTAVVPHRLATDDLRVLVGAGELLAASLDYEATLKSVAQLMVPQVADWCHIQVVEARDPAAALALTHVDPAKAEWAHRIRRRYPSVFRQDVETVVRTAEPVLHGDITDDMLRRRTQDAEHLEQVLSAKMVSALIVPLVARGRTLGAITLIGAESGRRFGPLDLPLMGELARQCAVSVDNTLLYREARQAQARYRALFDGTPDGTLVIDEEGRFLDANPAMETLSGYSRAELVTMRVGDLTVEGAGPPSLFHAVQRGQVRDEAEIRRKDGSVVHVDTHATPVSLPGENVYLSVLRDITEQKRAAAEIRRFNVELERMVEERTAELTLVNKEQESFIYTVSHDLRAPLVSLQGLTSIILEDFAADLPGDVLGHLERISSNAGKMQNLITDLLQLSQVGRVDAEPAWVDLGAVVRGVAEQLEHTVRARGGTIRINGALPTIWANETRMTQLVTNLVDNAVKYTPPDRAPVVEIDTVEHPDGWEITVRDNGVGIPRPWQEKVLGLFQRLPAGKKLNPGGTGVGLAIVGRIVERVGGRLWIESTEGVGTTFHVVLPVPTGEEASVSADTGTALAGGSIGVER